MPSKPPIHNASTRPKWHKAVPDKRALTGRPWRRLRALVLQRDRHLCQPCLRGGRVEEATEVDHKVPVEHGGTDALDNLQAICKRCHALKTATEGTGAAPHPGWLPVPACPVIVVTGPPGAGKTTYCNEHATAADTVIDLDECFRDVCGVHGHKADRRHLSAALRWRNKQLADLAERKTGRAFFIVAAPTVAECEWWTDKLKATHVRLDPGMDTCLSRVEATRQPIVRRWYEASRANDWRP